MEFDITVNPVTLVVLTASVIAALTVIYNQAVKPVVKAAKGFNKRWDDAGRVEELNNKIDAVIEAIRPTNGDSRSLSDRVDVAKRYSVEAKNHTQQLDKELNVYRKEEAKARYLRQRRIDKTNQDFINKLGSMGDRMSALEAQLRELLGKFEDE